MQLLPLAKAAGIVPKVAGIVAKTAAGVAKAAGIVAITAAGIVAVGDANTIAQFSP